MQVNAEAFNFIRLALYSPVSFAWLRSACGVTGFIVMLP